MKNSPEKIAVMYLKDCRGYNVGNANDYTDDLIKIFKADTFRDTAKSFLRGNEDFPPDWAKALEYFFKAEVVADKAVAFTKNFLERNPDVDPKFFNHTLRWELAQDNDFAKDFPEIILFHIAKTYEEGCGALQADMSKALEFYRKAAALGSADAKAKLAETRLRTS